MLPVILARIDVSLVKIEKFPMRIIGGIEKVSGKMASVPRKLAHFGECFHEPMAAMVLGRSTTGPPAGRRSVSGEVWADLRNGTRSCRPCVWLERCYVISDCAELETFASQFSGNSVCAFSMGYRSQKSRAEGADFCDMFRTV